MKDFSKHKVISIYILISVILILLAVHAFMFSRNNNPQSYCESTIRFIPIVGNISNAQDTNLSSTSTTPEADEDTILSELQSANFDPKVKVIVLLIDSNGGDPEMAEEITQEMAHIHKPKYVLIRGTGDSAAYWIASGADKIFSFRISDVGDIGITSSYVSTANQGDGQFVSLASGPYKDAGNPDAPLTSDEKAYMMQGVMNDYNLFVQAVSMNRHLPINTVKSLADGSSFLGDVAVQKGLIDSSGGWDALWQEINSNLHTQCYFVE